MKLIANILIEYLKHNKRLVVPKLGVFIVKQQSGNIVFSDLMRNDDGVLRSLLIAYGIQELEATGMIDRFVFEIRHATGRGDSFNIEGLGEFCPAENNTIKFKQQREPKVIGGRIKPPVEELNSQKERLKRRGPQRNTTSGNVNDSKRSSAHAGQGGQRRGKRQDETEGNISMTRPDDYLRGLKYDRNKNRKRSEEMSDNRGRSAIHSIVIVLLIAAAAFGIVWGLWQWTNGETIPITKHSSIQRHDIARDDTVIDEEVIEADTLENMTDSLNIEQRVLSNISVSK